MINTDNFNEVDNIFTASPEEIEQTGVEIERYFNEQDSFRDEFLQRQQAEIDTGYSLEDSAWASQTTFSEAGQLSGKNIMDVADSKNTSPNNISVMKDIVEGFSSGVYEAMRSLQEIGAWGGWKAAELVSGQKIDFDVDKDMRGIMFNQGPSQEAQTTAGKIAKGVGQVGAGLLMGGAISKAANVSKLASFAKNPWGQKAIGMLVNAAEGFMVDTMAFSANEENLADVLKSLGLPTIDAIAKSEDDSFWAKKLKNGVDGILAGVLISFVGKSAKMFYNHVPPEAVQFGAHAALLGYGAKQLLDNDTQKGEQDGSVE